MPGGHGVGGPDNAGLSLPGRQRFLLVAVPWLLISLFVSRLGCGRAELGVVAVATVLIALPVLAAVAARAEAAVANDSGVGHLAAAVGARTVSLFGPTRAEHFAAMAAR